MLSNANFLILDEPTNHLDMVSKEILENALNNYTGTVLYVSHDRYFINTTATRIIELTNKMTVNYIGNYDYYLEKKDILTAAALKDNQMNLTDGKTSAKSEGYITNNKNDIIDNPVKDTANLSQETASNSILLLIPLPIIIRQMHPAVPRMNGSSQESFRISLKR